MNERGPPDQEPHSHSLRSTRGASFLGGDEFRRTQKGNNNAFCQDNETSWYNWDLLQENEEIFRFTREMIALRKRNSVLRRCDSTLMPIFPGSRPAEAHPIGITRVAVWPV